MAGAVVGAIGGLFAIGIGPALVYKQVALLFGTPILGLICWLVSGPLGWLIGGQIGPRLGDRFESQRVEMIGGILGGLIPVLAIAWWGWYMAARH